MYLNTRSCISIATKFPILSFVFMKFKVFVAQNLSQSPQLSLHSQRWTQIPAQTGPSRHIFHQSARTLTLPTHLPSDRAQSHPTDQP